MALFNACRLGIGLLLNLHEKKLIIFGSLWGEQLGN